MGGHSHDMAAALTVCRTALVGTGWTISHPDSTNGCGNHSSPLVGSFQVLKAVFSHVENLLVQELSQLKVC